MACKKDYIRDVVKDETEAKRLEQIHFEIGKKAEDSKLFRKEDDNLMLIKNKVKEGFSFIGKINTEYGKVIAKLPKTPSFRHKLSVNVLPLSKTGEQTQLFQQENKAKQPPIKELNAQLIQILNKMGIPVTSMEWYRNWLQEKFGEDVPNSIGVADLTNKLVAIDAGKEDISTLPEEAAHFIVAAMMHTPLYQKLDAEIVNDPIYPEVFKRYVNTYKGNLKLVRFEAIGKLLGQSLIKQYPSTSKTQNRLITALKRLYEQFMNLFKKNKSLTEELDYISRQILLGGNPNLRPDLIDGEKFYQLDSEKYKVSESLDNLKDKLESIVKKRYTRLQIYKNRAVGDYATEEGKKVDALLKKYLQDKVTLGIVEFINDIGHDLQASKNKLKKVLEKQNNIAIAKELREIKSYVLPFKEDLKSIKAELAFRNNAEDKEIIDEITTIVGELDDLEIIYNDKVNSLMANYLFSYAQNNTNIKTPKDLELLLKEAKDISLTSRFLDSMAETTDDILGILDRVAKEAKERARINIYNDLRDLIALDRELKDNGIKNTEFMAEVDSAGNVTGNVVTEYNQFEYKKALNSAFKSIEEKVNQHFGITLPKDKAEREVLLDKTKGARKEWNRLWAAWFKDNTKPNPKAKEIIENKSKYFKDLYGEEMFKGKLRSDLAFTEWLNDNYSESVGFDGRVWVSYKKELALPADKYKNKQYTDIQNDPLKKKYYNKYIELKEQADKYLPINAINPFLLPQKRKDFQERLKKSGIKAIKEEFGDLKDREDDTEFGDRRQLADTDDIPVNFLPIYYTRRIENTEDLSLDITSTLASYLNMASNYKEMNKVIHILELGEEILSNRKVVTGENALSKGMEKLGLSGSKAYNRERGGNAYERYKDWMSMVVYGKMKEDEKWLSGLGVNTAKAIDMFNSYTSISGLAANVYSAVNNSVLGNALVRQEAFAREFISKGSLTFADKTYISELGGFLKSVNTPYSNNKLKLVGEFMDIMQDFKEKTNDLNTDRSTLGRMASKNSLYFLNSAGEHQIQWRTALAIMGSIKLKQGTKELNLWEALDIEDGKVVLKPNLKTLDGKDFTMSDVIGTGLKIKALNQKLHGIYNDVDRSAIQKWALGRMALVFRKFIKPGFNRRFDPKRFDYSLNSEVEGMYRTTLSFLNNVRKDLNSYKVIWNELNDSQKANVKRSALEFAYLMAAMMLAWITEAALDDEDDKKALSFMAYEFNRLYVDLSFYSNPKSVFTLINQPIAGVKTIQRTLDLADFTIFFDVNPFDDSDEFIRRYKTGPNKGEAKGYVALKRLTPVLNNIEALLTPEEKLKYFNSLRY